MITFDETIPKRYNTWGQQVRNLPPATNTHRPPPTQLMKYDSMTPSDIPFWNRLTKCNNILKGKVEKFVMGKFFFWIMSTLWGYKPPSYTFFKIYKVP